MRAIFILLLLGNLGFFGFHYFFAAKQDAVTNVKPANAATTTEGLQLLAERTDGPALQARTSKMNTEDLPRGSDDSGGELCTMIGPYGQLLQAEYAMERLIALGVPARIAPLEIKEGESYWVYLKPEVSEKEARLRLYELQSKNIESYLITKGELANGVAFGRFGDYAEAEARANAIKSQGYEVEIKMLPKMIQETWVVLDAGFAEKIDETVWADLLTKDSALEKRQNFCLGVASQ